MNVLETTQVDPAGCTPYCPTRLGAQQVLVVPCRHIRMGAKPALEVVFPDLGKQRIAGVASRAKRSRGKVGR